MQSNSDPYNTPMHRRIDALLLIIGAIIVAFLLLSSSDGHAANSVTPLPTAEKSTH
jgi:hypothetical protein